MAKTRWSIACRLMVWASSIAAAFTMIFSREEIVIDDNTFKLSTTFWGSFQFFTVMAFIGGIYSLLIIFLPNGTPLWRFVVAIDMILNMLGVASLGAAMYTYILLRAGNRHVQWWPVCNMSPEFCTKVKGAIIASTVGSFLNLLLMCYTVNVMVDPLLSSRER